MTEIREEIAAMIKNFMESGEGPLTPLGMEGVFDITDKILDLLFKPTGLVINRNGVIEDLTAEQAVELWKREIKIRGGDITLVDGSRIELKEKPISGEYEVEE